MSERMTAERLDEIKARADAATEGPWTDTREDESGGDITYAAVRGGLTIAFVPEDTREEHDNSDAWKDAAFIAHAREDVPAMLAEIERAWGECARYEERETQVSNILATALIEVDHDPAIKAVDMAQQAAGVIVGTLSRPTLTAKQAREQIEGDDPGCVCRAPGAMGGPCDWCGGVVETPPEMATTTGEDREMAGVGEDTCNAKSPDEYICTLAPGHSGGHVAHTNPRHIVSEWPVSQ